ncbi:hypothetical protein COEREDRAFT_89218 [Coemansia reversa NRRL 1564]|uniref:PH domain-containing protein n=1 Tax=Coemansia reversa (strain ATCC 12441 / NRRL 1564) TaxID=763665 RepID=A0A2G5B587_COERN|nr:hypothetical protein COEREDRAFT_89218 [Coemansia reversa NRRL 1564]|eukprot:PIA13887.1 hypothetical protein COEREDRAFT_89218 [Coemansia reversa NRRL 1564]
MSKSAQSDPTEAIGYLQKKSRFYGWNKYVFVLSKEALTQLSSEKQAHAKQGTNWPPTKVIGNASDINSKHLLTQKVKQVISLVDIAQITAQGKQDLCIVTASDAIVLRALTEADRNHWLNAIENAIAYVTSSEKANCDSPSPVLSCVAPSSEIPSKMAATHCQPVSLLPELIIAPELGDGLISGSTKEDISPQEKMAWLPSLTNLTDKGSTSMGDDSICESTKINEERPTTCGNKVPVLLGNGLQAKNIRIDTDAGSFDVDEFFDDNDDNLNALPSVVVPLAAAASKSELRLISQASNPQTKSCADIENCLDARDLASTEPSARPPLEETEGLAFGDTFGDFLGTFSRPSPRTVAQTRTIEDTPKLRDRAETEKQISGRGSHIDDNSKEASGASVASTPKINGIQDSNVQAIAINSAKIEPAYVTESSIADIACSFFDSVGLPELPVLGSTPEKKRPMLPADDKIHDDKPLVDLVNIAANKSTGKNISKAQTSTLDPPGQHNLGGQDMSRLKSMVTISGLSAAHDAESNGPAGIQSTLLFKYSESLSASRALLSTVGRQSRPKTMHDWQANTTKANAQRGMPHTAAIVQYEASPLSANTGISKVVRGQLTKELLQKEATSKPVVRRVRLTKSESKVPPLKAVRLRLDGSIVGSRIPANDSRSSTKHGLRHAAKDSRVENAGSVSQSALHVNNKNSETVHNVDAVSGFGEIQRRLQQVESQKKQQQQAKLLDNEASDGLRIADIIENRQDIPLAMQIEERRQVQQAKQQALLRQQLEHQRMQLELERIRMEQQQQQELFRRQSLCPDPRNSRRLSVASGAPSMSYGGWPDYSDGYAAHWAPTTDLSHHSAQLAQYSYHYSRPTTPMSSCGPTIFSQLGSRPASQYVGAATPGPQPTETHSRISANRLSINPRRQPGSAFVKQQQRSASRGGQSEISAASSESWHSHVAHSTRTSLHAKTEPLYEGSVFVGSPPLNIATAKRSSSFGYSDSRRSAGAGSNSRYPVMHAASNAPPVPPVPQHFTGSPVQGPPPLFQQASYAGPGYQQIPPNGNGWSTPYANAHQSACPPYTYAGNQSSGDTQRMYRRRSEMSANAPSLLQQLNKAQVSGIMPGWAAAEKQSYSKGAYQNANVPKIIREGTGAHYLGDGNTLLIDQVYESEKTKRAFLKKVSRTYTGVGGEAAPTPVFMH